MTMTPQMEKMLRAAECAPFGRLWAADFPGDRNSQSAFWRTGEALKRRGFLFTPQGKTGRLEAFEITDSGIDFLFETRTDAEPSRGDGAYPPPS
jgi:hypothetical protein